MSDAPEPPPPSEGSLGDDPAPGASHDPPNDATPGGAPPARRLGDPTDERPVPRGCNPLVFGVVMATIQLAVTVYFMRTC